MASRQLSGASSDEESPRRRVEAKPPRGAPPSKEAEASLDDIVMDSGEDEAPDAIVVEAPESRRTSISSEAPEPTKLRVPEQQKSMAPTSRRRKNNRGQDTDAKAFLSSDDDNDYSPHVQKMSQGGSNTYYDSDYADNYYNEEDWNPWSCENILVGAQLVCCLIVVIAVLAAMIIPMFAYKLDPGMRMAVQTGDIEVVRLLLSNGSATHVDATGTRDMTALHWASLRGQTEVAELLLENRASTAKMSGSGLMPLHYAVKGGHKGVVGALLKAEADSNATTNNGWTPLHWAGTWGRADVARMLVAADANPMIQCEDRVHKTALSLAQSNGHSALIRILDKAMEAYVERVNASLLLQLNSTSAP